ncbi:MAG: hypothetical protein NT062_29960 [Proteobacteria bacterium]|nr:hypothetical protein [Pseudomonadota bacterium]
MKAPLMLIAVTLATTSPGCMSYVVTQRSKSHRIQPEWVVASLGLEVGLGTLFGVALHGANEDHPTDVQLGLPAWIALGNVTALVFDAVTMAVMLYSDQ